MIVRANSASNEIGAYYRPVGTGLNTAPTTNRSYWPWPCIKIYNLRAVMTNMSDTIDNINDYVKYKYLREIDDPVLIEYLEWKYKMPIERYKQIMNEYNGKETEEEYIQIKKREINHLRQDAKHLLAVSEVAFRTKQEQKSTGHKERQKSLKDIYYWKQIKEQNVSGLTLARIGDSIAREKEISAIYETAKVLGFTPKLRSEVSDYQRRKLPRVRRGRNTFYLTKSEEVEK